MVLGFCNYPFMESKLKVFTVFVFLVVTCIAVGSANSLHYQTLVVETLWRARTQSHDLSWSESSLSQLEAFETSMENLTVRLEHRDALSFNAAPEDLFKLRLERDLARVETLSTMAAAAGSRNATGVHGKDFSSSIISGFTQGSGEYFTRLGVGTPPKYLYMVLDTGSDIIWIQCKPCRKCYNQTDPIFDPKKSGSYAVVPCSSPLCRRLDAPGCSQRRFCLYEVSYGDGSFTVGVFSTETLTFHGAKVENVALGCGHDNEGLFVGAAGLLGLGRGRMSFPTQTGSRFGQKFSYCLADRQSSASKPSSAIFGESSVPKSAVFAPMLTNPKLDTFYYIELTGISVGGSPVPEMKASMFRLDAMGNGGVIIDSGTSVTRLTRPAYIALRNAFRRGTQLKPGPAFSLFDTCYDLSGKSVVKVPTVEMHFGGGTNLVLPASNYLIPVDNNGTFCFAFAGTTTGLSIIGNIQQQGFRVVFDVAGSRIGFSPNECS